jgi:hypothetical protein
MDVLALLIYAGGIVALYPEARKQTGRWRSAWCALLWPAAVGAAIMHWSERQFPEDRP